MRIKSRGMSGTDCLLVRLLIGVGIGGEEGVWRAGGWRGTWSEFGSLAAVAPPKGICGTALGFWVLGGPASIIIFER